MLTPTKDEVSRQLKSWRRKQGLTQFDAANVVGTTISTWNAWENKKHRPQRMALVLLHEHGAIKKTKREELS